MVFAIIASWQTKLAAGPRKTRCCLYHVSWNCLYMPCIDDIQNNLAMIIAIYIVKCCFVHSYLEAWSQVNNIIYHPKTLPETKMAPTRLHLSQKEIHVATSNFWWPILLYSFEWMVHLQITGFPRCTYSRWLMTPMVCTTLDDDMQDFGCWHSILQQLLKVHWCLSLISCYLPKETAQVMHMSWHIRHVSDDT